MSLDCYDGDPAEVYNERSVRAAKERPCDACDDPIRRGDIYIRDALLYDGRWDIVVRCLRCDAIYQHLVKVHEEDRRKRDHEEYPDRSLNCGHTYQKRWGHDPPPEIARLAFMTPDEVQAELAAKQVAP